MKRSALSFIKFFIGWPLSLLAFFYIYQLLRPEISNISQHLTRVNLPLLGISVLCFMLYYLLRAYAWQCIVKALGHDIPLHQTFFLYTYSELKRYIPGNIWSFLSRTVLYTKRGVEKKSIVNALLIEAELVVVCCIVIALFCSTFLLGTVLSVPYAGLTRTVLIVLTILGLVVYIFQSELIEKFSLHRLGFLRPLFSHFSWKENFRIVAWSIASYIFFGLGYFFSIISVITLSPQLIILVTALSVFSLLVGYLSFLTPTGLGVREGMLLLGLAKFTSLPLASFATIFARIILIITEVIAIGLSYLLYHAKHIEKLSAWVGNHRHSMLVIAAMTVFTMYFTTVNFLRFDHYYTGRFDLGNMAQTVWNTKHGNFFAMTDANGTEQISRLAFHADFLLILLTPFYFLWEDPRMLLLIQTVVVAFGAWYLFKIAQHVLKHDGLAAILSISFLLNPSLQRAVIYDFHAVVLATTFLLAAFYHLLKKQYMRFALFAVLAGITKEQVWLILAFFGGIIAFIQKKYLFGIAFFAVCAAVFYTLIWHAIPNAYGSKHFALSYFSESTEDPTQLIAESISNPAAAWDLVIEKERISYLKKLLVPVGYLPLLTPHWLVFALPDLTINMLSQKGELHQIYYQYTAIITPFLFIASLYAVGLLRKYSGQNASYIIGLYLLFTAFYSAYYYGPLPGAKESNLAMFTKPLPEKSIVDQSLATIPEDAKVSATNNLGSHLSHRKFIYTIPYGIDSADYVAFLLSDPTIQARATETQALLTNLAARSDLRLVAREGNFLLFQRR